MTLALIAFSTLLQAITVVLAMRLALAKRILQKLPARWAWVLAAAGLLVMLASRGLALLGTVAPPSAAAAREPSSESIIAIVTSACLAIAVIALFRRLTRTEATSRRQREELATIYRVVMAATSTLELDQVLRQIYEEVSQLIPLDTFCIALYDKASDDLRMELIVEGGRVQPKFTIKVGDGGGLTASVVRSRKTLRISDVKAERDRLPTLPRQTNATKTRSWMGLPLIVQGRVVGAMSVQSYRPNAFSADDEWLLTTIAAQTAVAIEKARLYHDMQASEERHRTLIENAKDAFFIENENDDILEVNAAACKLLGYRREELLKMKVTDLLAPEERGQVGKLVKSELARHDKIFEAVNVHCDGTRIPVEVSIARMAGNEKGLALAIVRDITEHKRAEAAWRESEARFRLLFASAQRQTQELELLDQVRTALAREMDLPKVFHTVVEAIVKTFGYEHVSIYLLQDDVLVLQSEVGYKSVIADIPISQGICGRVARTGQPVLLQDVRTDPEFLATIEGIQSKVCVPVFDQDRVVGVLNVETTGGVTLTETELQLMMALSEHIGIAISRARLYQQTSRSLARLQALSQISRAVSSSLDLGQVLTNIARHAAELSNSDAAGIFELDATRQVLSISASHNASAEFVEAANSTNIKVGQGIIGQAVATRRPAEIIDTLADPNYPFPQLVAISGFRSMLAVPMINGKKLVGGIVIWRKQPRPFDRDIVELLTTLADQSVVAIENARLYHEATRRLEEVLIIQAVALAGAAGQPFDDIVAEATHRLCRLWDSHHLGFLFPDETGTLRVHPSYIGVAAELKRDARFAPGEGITGKVFQTGQPVIISDTRQDPHYIEGTQETRSEMVAPLVVGDRVIGVVNVESTRLNAFSADDIRLLSALAGQLAIILDNAQAHRDLADRAQQLQDAYNELAEAEQLKDQLIQNISHELRTPMTYIRGFAELMLTEAFGPLPAELREPVEIVNRKTETIARLIERIVALQATSPAPLTLEPLKMADSIQEMVARWQAPAQRAGIEMNLDLPTDLPLIAGDRRRLGEAFDNLLSNAVKFSPKGGRVTIRAHGETELVHVEIADTGVGIPPDKLSKVFDRFYQVDGSATRRFGGTGIGLALVRQIILSHGGRVWAESKGPGQGSTFHLVLPTAPAGTRQ